MLKIKPKKRIEVSPSCDLCGKCASVCPTGAVKIDESKLKIDAKKCVACYACVILCPKGAIKIEWFDGKRMELEI